jgi:OPT family small oligopeptide transporter
MRRFLVWPAAMLWPSTLINTTLFHTLFRDMDPEIPGWKISRYRYFMYIFVGMFIWNWIPGYIFTALSNFAFVTWIRPNDVVLNQVFGSLTGSFHHQHLLMIGLDIIPLTIDWSQVSGYLLSPLMTPFWAIGNVFVSFAFWIWFITPILHFTNVWYGKYMPISTAVSYDNTGKKYKVANILNSNFQFDLAKYKAYSPLFLGTTFALAYGLSFGAITSVLVHTYLFYGEEIWRQFKESLNQEDDIHMKLNKAYKQAPDWWYLALGVGMFGMAIGVCEGWDTQMVLSWLTHLLITALVGGDFGSRDGSDIFRSLRYYSSNVHPL